ncbi:MAG: hypothetical protein A3A43_01180 [Candidatus Liptonbacteria bacterium RIFCSPLOWO2_01_FULL_56_20]|uniref:DUF3185 domain-containing protein n=1 Tax=Candidatus Liptonbacteria bacterium RIFCSPLOWO2_01_FULL_56_20 TaxID=1798652 RepID=A0A1G2CJG3_9BACT|nr:MAG: hypothetical protein UY96_C0007G0018 [Parcubacteria group bacterium GW2011_GWB1_56_8]OGZ01387.1 MAG: hypothetical protein A3A43_01180 [Candidatus Liptonbacteria bacterium RIFCSPLOWO2_01_FULL_56_20]
MRKIGILVAALGFVLALAIAGRSDRDDFAVAHGDRAVEVMPLGTIVVGGAIGAALVILGSALAVAGRRRGS